MGSIGMSKVRMTKKGQCSHFLGRTTPPCLHNKEEHGGTNGRGPPKVAFIYPYSVIIMESKGHFTHEPRVVTL